MNSDFKGNARTVRVRVPATIGNLGPGFDVLGLALEMHSEYEIIMEGILPENHTEYEFFEKGAKEPSRGANIIEAAMVKVFREYGKFPEKCAVTSDNKIPLSRGLGSSAAARVAGIMAANRFFGGTLSKEKMFQAASVLEGHPDNAAPAFYGGVVVSAMYEDACYALKISGGKGLKVVVNIPEAEVLTEKARKVFKPQVPRAEACGNLTNLSASFIAWYKGEYGLLGKSTVDYLHQPYRAKLVPGMENVFKAALESGAYGAVLSGSGPSIAALCPDDNSVCRSVGRAMAEAREKGRKKIKSYSKISAISEKGAEIY